MRKMTLIVLAVGLALAGLLSAAHSQEDMTAVANDSFDRPQRSAARFVHDEHNETAELEDCAECHHVYDDAGVKSEDETSEDQSCADCHDIKANGRQPGLMKAFHTNCKGCHLERKKGPITCGQCHQIAPE